MHVVTHAIFIIIVFTVIVHSYITSTCTSLHPGLSHAKSNGTRRCSAVRRYCLIKSPVTWCAGCMSVCYACWFHARNVIEYLWLAQCLCLEQSKIRQASSGQGIIPQEIGLSYVRCVFHIKKDFHMVPLFLTLWHWPWSLTYFWQLSHWP